MHQSIPADIQRAIIKYEGSKYTNDAKDPGGPTKYGWTLKSYRYYVDKNATISDIKSMTSAEAIKYYDRYFWKKYNSYKIQNHNLAGTVLLAQINLGPVRPNKLLQRMSNVFCDSNIKVDGVLGSRSIKAINSCRHLWPGFPYVLFHYYNSAPTLQPVMRWARRGLRRRVLHYVQSDNS